MKNIPNETKESLIQRLVDAFPHFSKEDLEKHNDKQIYNLYSACLDEDGNLKQKK